ncbi:MAG: tryptophan synthase subunit alpha [Desulfomonilia bacterium]|jgi:tryptophan synthase alpha chain
MISEAIRAHRKAVIPYVTAGYAGLDATGEIIRALDECGAAAIEVGIPFSDPMADGPVLQKASLLALRAGFALEGLLKRAGRWSASARAPLIVMSYLNPLMRRGIPETLARMKDSGMQGLIVPDLPSDASRVYDMCLKAGIDLIRLIAPTTPEQRMREVISQCRGFVYAVTVKGVTGARASLSPDVRRQVRALKNLSGLPVCAGFGVSSARQVEEMLSFADGVIVGSYLMSRIMESEDPVKAASEAFRALMG